MAGSDKGVSSELFSLGIELFPIFSGGGNSLLVVSFAGEGCAAGVSVVCCGEISGTEIISGAEISWSVGVIVSVGAVGSASSGAFSISCNMSCGLFALYEVSEGAKPGILLA